MAKAKAKEATRMPTEAEARILVAGDAYKHFSADEFKAECEAMESLGWLKGRTQMYLNGNARVGDRGAVSSKRLYEVTEKGRKAVALSREVKGGAK